ncbi:hypothetical protein SBRY_70407 [Actinacidiphila bryophytorum]|uniref:Uncharacterized protein n=1 Tax=Actinacidiphila bryophytorum TaxID=1436133 RepID=A0A9W4H7N9_9ACTN|nr:hypothetical protein SBRY_70407 [Actinacidiphila bryophytorum]
MNSLDPVSGIRSGLSRVVWAVGMGAPGWRAVSGVTARQGRTATLRSTARRGPWRHHPACLGARPPENRGISPPACCQDGPHDHARPPHRRMDGRPPAGVAPGLRRPDPPLLRRVDRPLLRAPHRRRRDLRGDRRGAERRPGAAHRYLRGGQDRRHPRGVPGPSDAGRRHRGTDPDVRRPRGARQGSGGRPDRHRGGPGPQHLRLPGDPPRHPRRPGRGPRALRPAGLPRDRAVQRQPVRRPLVREDARLTGRAAAGAAGCGTEPRPPCRMPPPGAVYDAGNRQASRVLARA